MHAGRAVLVVPPPSVMAGVEAIRKRFDPLVDVVAAHVTLVFPFESAVSNEALRRHIESVTRGVSRFEIELSGFSCVEDRYLFLNVASGAEQIRDLHRRLYTGPLTSFLADRPYTPHVTVGRFRSAEECATAMKGVEAEDLRVTAVVRAATVYDLGTTPYSTKFEVEWR